MPKKGNTPWNKGKNISKESIEKRNITRKKNGWYKDKNATIMKKKLQVPWNKNTQGIMKANSGSFTMGHTRGLKTRFKVKGETAITPTTIKIRNCCKYLQWRSDVFQRDNWTCGTCGEKGKTLNAHHIKPFALILKEYNIRTLEEGLRCNELWDINNGQTLCKECHELIPRGKI